MASKRIEGKWTGGCQCGAVRYRLTARLDNAHICHCRMCQKQVGGPFMALVASLREDFSWTRGKPAMFKSSAHVDRGFCADCGTPLTYDETTSPHVNFSIGSFDDPATIAPNGQVGTESRMPWFADLADLPNRGETGTYGDDAGWADAIAASNRQHPDHETDHWPPEGWSLDQVAWLS